MRECASVLEVEENANVEFGFPVKLDRGSPIQGLRPHKNYDMVIPGWEVDERC